MSSWMWYVAGVLTIPLLGTSLLVMVVSYLCIKGVAKERRERERNEKR